jgi:cation/acetate symporter
MNPAVGIAAVAAVSVATAVIGFYGLRISRTTGDFYVASRTVPPWWNASAIGGEYLSAASFLGVAGLILLSGTDALWFPVGYTAGYLMLLLFVAAPLRRSGAYTIPISPRPGSIRGRCAVSPAWLWSWWAGCTSSRSCTALP